MSKKLRGLFRKQEKDVPPIHRDAGREIETAPLTTLARDTEDPIAQIKSVTKFVYATGQSVGLVRKHNEDTLFAMSSFLSDGADDRSYGVFIIADGMGGHQNGEIASRVAINVSASDLMKEIELSLSEGDPQSLVIRLEAAVESAIQNAHRSVKTSVPGGGTTLTILVVAGHTYIIGHVGDSRLYLIDDKKHISVLTKDHSFVQKLIDLHEITEEEARTHPNRNMILRAIGQHEPLAPDVITGKVPLNGYLMLCSDGLWGMVRNEQLLKTVEAAKSCEQACQALLDLANKAGGLDNISVILVKFSG